MIGQPFGDQIGDLELVAVLADNRRSLWFAAGAFGSGIGLSVTSCLSSGLSEPGGAGLGTLGLHPGLAERMCREAGFSRFARHDFDDPVNLYYEVRP